MSFSILGPKIFRIVLCLILNTNLFVEVLSPIGFEPMTNCLETSLNYQISF